MDSDGDGDLKINVSIVDKSKIHINRNPLGQMTDNSDLYFGWSQQASNHCTS